MGTLTIEQKNSLIAVYTGGKLNEDKFSGAKYFTGLPFAYHAYSKNLPYDHSYNRLMPIVKKVMDELATVYQNPNVTRLTAIRHFSNIRAALDTCYNGIQPLYDATVEAIQFINSLNEVK